MLTTVLHMFVQVISLSSYLSFGFWPFTISSLGLPPKKGQGRPSQKSLIRGGSWTFRWSETDRFGGPLDRPTSRSIVASAHLSLGRPTTRWATLAQLGGDLGF